MRRGVPLCVQYRKIVMSSELQTRSKVETNVFLKEPTLFKLIYINDNQTDHEFVIETLLEIFHYTTPTAESLTIEVHETGSAVVAVLPYEMAEQKGIEVTLLARANGYPLQVKIEPDL